MTVELFVLHDIGAVDAGRPWRDAAGRWAGPVIAPDLPGHGEAPPPVGGHHELGDAVFHVIGTIAPAEQARVVLGVGANGWSAQVLALGGRADGLVLVDGLGGPWMDVPERNAALRAARRRILEHPTAMQPQAPHETDPRAAIGVLAISDLDHARAVATAMPVPTLVIESPGAASGEARDELVSAHPDAVLRTVASIDPVDVVAMAADWWSSTRRR